MQKNDLVRLACRYEDQSHQRKENADDDLHERAWQEHRSKPGEHQLARALNRLPEPETMLVIPDKESQMMIASWH
jgi:hypothetical protein